MSLYEMFNIFHYFIIIYSNIYHNILLRLQTIVWG